MEQIYTALRLNTSADIVGDGRYASCFMVSDLAAASMGAVGSAISGLIEALGLAPRRPGVCVDQELASLWFAQSIYPIGWEMPPVWDAIAGDYETRGGWIRLHTNLPHHRNAVLEVIQRNAIREDVKDAVRDWDGDDLETEIVAAGGAVAVMRSLEEWRTHPQGRALKSEPLIHWSEPRSGAVRDWKPHSDRPLKGLRVLDLTRVLAGPVATRTLAGFGADVLRIDPPGWDEPNVAPDITLGKRCSVLQLDAPEDRRIFDGLLSQADVLIHGYRPGALDRLGYDEATRLRMAPHLIDVSLNAYGWTGPWSIRRGFDSLVQMSSGIAACGMDWAQTDRPTPLPVQALDHATGYLMAAAVLRALLDAVTGKGLINARLSLARTALLLIGSPQKLDGRLSKEPASEHFLPEIEHTHWGRAHRLKSAISVAGVPMHWDRAASALGSSPAAWLKDAS